MLSVLVTGGSGFIGTNLIQYLLSKNYQVMSIDEREPQNKDHLSVFKRVNILDLNLFRKTVQDFQPSHIVHLAARTDLDGKTIDAYSANTKGVQNLISIINNEMSVKQVIFTSTKYVYSVGYHPKSEEDYCPDTLYGESKVFGEKLVRENTDLKCTWCILRPTSIWGPWFSVPYRGFFIAVNKGYYFHPGKFSPLRSYGYVGNSVFQLEKVMQSSSEMIHRKTFYLTDYDEFTIRQWANMISNKLRGRSAFTVPESVIQLAAFAGDFLKKLGWKNPPMTSYRLHNMRQDTSGVPLAAIKQITGPIPYSMKQGVEETIAWMKQQCLI